MVAGEEAVAVGEGRMGEAEAAREARALVTAEGEGPTGGWKAVVAVAPGQEA